MVCLCANRSEISLEGIMIKVRLSKARLRKLLPLIHQMPIRTCIFPAMCEGNGWLLVDLPDARRIRKLRKKAESLAAPEFEKHFYTFYFSTSILLSLGQEWSKITGTDMMGRKIKKK